MEFIFRSVFDQTVFGELPGQSQGEELFAGVRGSATLFSSSKIISNTRYNKQHWLSKGTINWIGMTDFL
jgi:hypothetical protein